MDLTVHLTILQGMSNHLSADFNVLSNSLFQ
jgi:hypothetical protein